LLIRPIEIYEFSYSNINSIKYQNNLNLNSNFKLQPKATYSYKSNQIIKGTKNLQLVANILTFKIDKLLNKNDNIKLLNNQKITSVDFQITEKINLNNYISPYLKYKNLQSCFLIQAKSIY
jgi:hypothetical protein